MTEYGDNDRSLSQVERRRVLRFVAGGALGGFLGSLCKTACCEETKASPEENEGKEVEGTDDKSKMAEEAYRLGHQYEKEHGGCAQCAVAAIQDAIPFLKKDAGLFRAASALDGGATPTGLQNCGSFTGAGMVIGYVCGGRRKEDFKGSNKLAHQLIRKLYQHYEEHYETVLCKDVREKAERRCEEVVGLAAKWTAQILLDEFGIDGPEKGSSEPRH